jgi:uncharacterized protein (DUF302 family)
MMMKTYTSQLGFQETVEALEKNAVECGWGVTQKHDLQEIYIRAGFSDMTKVKIIYLCNPEGGYAILQNDELKALSVMMPMPVSIHERNDGTVGISAMNLGMMSGMFAETAKEVLANGAENFERSLSGII